MSLSLAAEPRRKGLFEPYYWARPSSNQQALLPLLFPEPLPSLHLLDRTQLVRGRVDSDASDVFTNNMNVRASPEHPRTSPVTQRNHMLSHQGTVIPVYNGELLLVVQKGALVESAPNSRPTSSVDEVLVPVPVPPPVGGVPDKTISRKPSIRVKPSSSQGLERKTSMAKRSSLPSLLSSSQRPSTSFMMTEPSSTTNPPLRVVVQAGTLNMLIRILVQGLPGVSVSVADDNGEMSLREGISRELVLDRNEFARVWWNVFRSFVTPLAFFEVTLNVCACVRVVDLPGVVCSSCESFISRHNLKVPPRLSMIISMWQTTVDRC